MVGTVAGYGEADYSEYSTEEQQQVLYEQIGFGAEGLDPVLHDLFYDYFYNDDLTLRQRLDVWDQLQARVEDEYGIMFDAVWDWEAFREWYESL